MDKELVTLLINIGFNKHDEYYFFLNNTLVCLTHNIYTFYDNIEDVTSYSCSTPLSELIIHKINKKYKQEIRKHKIKTLLI